MAAECSLNANTSLR